MALSDKQKSILNDFTKFVRDELGIETMPKILIINGRGELKTTANYDYTKKEKIVKINGKNRATVDIMRSLAHELTHHKQYEQGRLKVKPPDIGGPIEDEANAKAGQFIKLFAKKHNNIYDLDEAEEPTSQAQTSSLESPSSSSSTSSSSPGAPGTPSTSPNLPDGYPEVGHWESGASRGVANQVDTASRWNSLYGIVRGKANQLK